ncbi:matrix metalloproteinase-27-like, partial [Schistocerca piceifrons]|uniref:matrix metalloproteinase-27-like n=1 Tax=Schistocerca piceifrons TaxID=274613 RepID=UPI001F5FB25C
MHYKLKHHEDNLIYQYHNHNGSYITPFFIDFQEFYNLNINGQMDSDTLKLLDSPRCGVEDQFKVLVHEIGHALGIQHANIDSVFRYVDGVLYF